MARDLRWLAGQGLLLETRIRRKETLMERVNTADLKKADALQRQEAAARAAFEAIRFWLKDGMETRQLTEDILSAVKNIERRADQSHGLAQATLEWTGRQEDRDLDTLTRLELLIKRVVGVEAAVHRFDRRLEEVIGSLEDCRNLLERQARSMGELAQDQVEGQLDQPLRELAVLHGKLTSPGEAGKVQAFCQYIEHILDSHGVSLINPSEGESFDPRRHQIIEKRRCVAADLDGRIAGTHQPGLCRPHRVVHPARVAIFEFDEAPIPDKEQRQ